MADERCKKRIYRGDFHESGCLRRAWKDGFCRQHHPATEAARRDEWRRKFDAGTASAKKRNAIENAERAVIEAAEKWRDADNPGNRRLDAFALQVAIDVLRKARQ
jgi:hypothetical protein